MTTHTIQRALLSLIALIAITVEAYGNKPLCTDSIKMDTRRRAAIERADSIRQRTDSLLRVNDSIMAATKAYIDSISIQEMLTADSIAQRVEEISDSLRGVSTLPAPAKKHFIPDSHRSMWLGIIFPGAGQIYNRKYWKLPIFYGGFLGCLYALNWNNQMYSDYKKAYLDIMDSDPNTNSFMDMLPLNYDISGREEYLKSVFKRKKNYYRKYRDMSMFCMIAVWALSVIDAYVDAELSTFDISPALSMKVAPSIFSSQDLARQQSVMNTGVKIGVKF